MRERSNRAGTIIVALVLIIFILAAVIGYTLLIKPQFDNYVLEKQLEAQSIVVNALLLQIQQTGSVQLSDAEGNVIVLAPVQQQAQPTQ